MAPMEFHLSCECGTEHVVDEGSAGAAILCACGDTFTVPSLAELRQAIGLSAMDVPLDLLIIDRVHSRDLPPHECAVCGSGSTSIWNLTAVCEKTLKANSASVAVFSTVVVLLTALVSFGTVFALREDDDDTPTQIHGRDTIVPVPLSLCDRCRGDFPGEALPGFIRFAGIACFIAAGVAWLMYGYTNLVPVLIAGGVVLPMVSTALVSRGQTKMKQTLCNVPIYEQLLTKYPNSIITQPY